MKRYLCLKASAGSGKTFALSVRYISLMLLGANPTEILTLTFTNKAANEMKERIFNTLFTLGDDEVYLNEIAKNTGLDIKTILGRKPYMLQSFISSELSIYTIDKFVNKILREFCGYAGVNDDFEIKEDRKLELTFKFLESLNKQQFDDFVEFFSYESKKFDSLIDIFKSLIEKNENFDPVYLEAGSIDLQKENVLKYAFGIKDYVLSQEKASASALKSVAFDDFDSLMDKSKTWSLKESFAEFSYFKKFSSPHIEEVFLHFREELSRYYHLRSAYALSKFFTLFKSFESFRDKYISSQNYLEFSDIANLSYKLLSNSIDKEFLYFRLDSKYEHILMDEFQDTSVLQFKILKPLIDEVISGKGSGFKSFFYVGDTKQSIYRFRGGRSELFDYVSSLYEKLEVESLNTNYRSCSNVIEFVNDTFLKLPAYEYEKQLFNKKGGYVEVFNSDKFGSEEEFEDIALKIDELMKNGVNANSIAILTYTNGEVLNLFNFLSERFKNIKISTEMTSKLINQQKVKAIINLIKYYYFTEDIYKENFNSLIGKEPTSQIEFRLDIYNNSLETIITSISEHYKLFDKDVIKFLEVCNSYDGIVDFIFEIDHLDTSMEPKEQHGLQILTIFKSKGLEFDTVILLDRMKRKNSDKSSLLFDYDKIDLNTIYYKIKGLESFNKDYEKAIKKEKSLGHTDELNVLYVALTRAKNNLIIIKKSEKSVFESVGIGSENKSIGTLEVSSVPKIQEKQVQKVKYKPLNLGHQNIKVAKEIKEDTIYAKYFGIATHYVLEMMDKFDDSSLEFALSLSYSKYASYLSDSDFDDIRLRIKQLIDSEQFQSIIKNKTFTKEQSLIFNDELKIIDLLLKDEREMIICDYKTTKSSHTEHFSQVGLYKKAIGVIHPEHDVQGYLIYLHRDGLEFLEV